MGNFLPVDKLGLAKRPMKEIKVTTLLIAAIADIRMRGSEVFRYVSRLHRGFAVRVSASCPGIVANIIKKPTSAPDSADENAGMGTRLAALEEAAAAAESKLGEAVADLNKTAEERTRLQGKVAALEGAEQEREIERRAIGDDLEQQLRAAVAEKEALDKALATEKTSCKVKPP
eukprot:scaffold233773_cov36-Prasinocladus_malaysianus.AAC.1